MILINKYINYKLCNLFYMNNIKQNFKVFIKEYKNLLLSKNNKLNIEKKYFFSMQKIYLKLRHTLYFGRLFFFKLYQIYLFWFLYFYNKLYFYYTNILFNIWIRIYYLNLNTNNFMYLNNNNLYIYMSLYKKILNEKFFYLEQMIFFNRNRYNFNYISINLIKTHINNKIYKDYNKYFNFIINLNMEKEYNLLDCFIKMIFIK